MVVTNLLLLVIVGLLYVIGRRLDSIWTLIWDETHPDPPDDTRY